MLAYTFWHKRSSEISLDDYEKKLIRFHQVLEESGLAGFRGCVVTRIPNAPWLAPSSEAYEEWYVMDGSDVVDKLNDTAVSGARKGPHDEIAHIATDFRGGLYQPKIGSFSNVCGSSATWFSKPSSTTYQSFYDEISKHLTKKGSLWRRQMVLGPTSEFCITTSDNLEIQTEFKPFVIPRKIIWQSDRLAE